MRTIGLAWSTALTYLRIEGLGRASGAGGMLIARHAHYASHPMGCVGFIDSTLFTAPILFCCRKLPFVLLFHRIAMPVPCRLCL